MDTPSTSRSYAHATSAPLVVHLSNRQEEEVFTDVDNTTPSSPFRPSSPQVATIDNEIEQHNVETTGQEDELMDEKIKHYTTSRSIRISTSGNVQVEEIITECEKIIGNIGEVEQVCFKPNNIIEIGLTTADAKEKLIGHSIKVGSSFVTCESLDEDLLMVTVRYVPNEADKEVVKGVLSEYGKVSKVLVNTITIKDRKFKTGTYRVLIKTRKLLPNYVNMLGSKVELHYIGRKKQCWHCGSLTHEIKECNQKLCHRCKSPHHLVRDCPCCYSCYKIHEADKQCPEQSLNEIYRMGGRNKNKEKKTQKKPRKNNKRKRNRNRTG
ncbi:uncharacterized protein LOC111626428 [Centruroides sculpturatus]|uniref:uncharacterized protein LOC111626428 n=1 Tax=Centruroides sculpturatus TaxID=218467 RepID=UPI000C6CD66E|nr:uncharacterized protein LOC111626428 [Centruroides sculpturatus]